MSLRPSDPELFIHKNASLHKHVQHSCVLGLTLTDGNTRGTASGGGISIASFWVFFFLSFFFGLPLSKQLERESQCPGLGCLISASAAVAPCPAHREDKPVLLMVSAGHPPGGGCHFYTAPSSLPPPSSLPVSTRGLYSFCLLWLVPEPQT